MPHEVKAKMGVTECMKHGKMEPFQVLFEKQGKHRQYWGGGRCVDRGTLATGGLYVILLSHRERTMEVCCSLISGEFVAQFKYTVLLMSEGPRKITGLPFEKDLYKSEHSVKDEKLAVSIFHVVNSRW